MTGQSPRFGFGRNWMQYARLVDEPRVAEARASLSSMLDRDSLDGLSFLDIGTGSGLFSLAARRLGARVRGFDFDPESVECARSLRDRFDEAADVWQVEQGSILDAEYAKALGFFDVVYAWGVLHHTGAMWQALDHAAARVADNGMLYIALYNHQAWLTRYWACVKRLYNRNVVLRWILTAVHTPYFVGLRWLVRRMTGKRSPERGMNLWYDMKDWLGGYPFEAATPGAVLAFLRSRGFQLEKLATCGGRHGCNEYLFTRRSSG